MKILSQRRVGIVPLMAAALLWVALPAQAVQLGFQNISNNLAGDAAIGEAQLFVDVTEDGSNQVSFLFSNMGPDASSITDVYFESGPLASIMQIIDASTGGNAGVDFSQGAAPGNLPSANNASPPFQATVGLTADSNPPAQPNGVNPGETLEIIFDLQSGLTFADVENALGIGGQPDGLRIGIHVQGFATGGSESFVNTPPPGTNPVPEPSALLLFGSGLIGLTLWGKRKFQSRG